MNRNSLLIITTLLETSSSIAKAAPADAASGNAILRGGSRQPVVPMESSLEANNLSGIKEASGMIVNRRTIVATCGNGSVGNGICPQAGLCCSTWGYCGSTPDYCNSKVASNSNSALNTTGSDKRGNQVGRTIGIVIGVIVLLVIGFVLYRNRHRFQWQNVGNLAESNNSHSSRKRGPDSNSNTSNCSNTGGTSPEARTTRSDPPATNSGSQLVFHEDQTIVSGLTIPIELEPNHHQGDNRARMPDDSSY